MINYFYNKDIGARASQQDSVTIQEKDGVVFIVLGDGMGGHKGGEFASKTLIETAISFFNKSFDKNNITNFLDSIIQETINKLTIHAKKTNTDPRTTAAFAVIVENDVYFANIGDSRVYLFKEDGLVTRSRDHSIPEMLFQAGEIKEDEIATHPDQNKLLKSVGPNSQDQLTHYKYSFKENEEFAVLVCSDGLWEYVTSQEMQNFIFRDEPQVTIDKMITIAKNKGKERGDNISVGIFVKKIENKNIQNKASKNSKIYILLLVVFLIGGYFIFQNNNSKNTNIDKKIENNNSQNKIENNSTNKKSKNKVDKNILKRNSLQKNYQTKLKDNNLSKKDI